MFVLSNVAGHTLGRGEESAQGFCGKARRKETTWKTRDVDGGWDQNGS
jgi:hypothetical protein